MKSNLFILLRSSNHLSPSFPNSLKRSVFNGFSWGKMVGKDVGSLVLIFPLFKNLIFFPFTSHGWPFLLFCC